MRGWGEDYSLLRNRTFREAAAKAGVDWSSGRSSGTGVHRQEAYASAIGLLSDQFWGSGHAWLTVDAEYRWYVAQGGHHIEVGIYRVIGRFRDVYQWQQDVDPLEYMNQQAGRYVKFPIRGEWADPASFWRVYGTQPLTVKESEELPDPPDISPLIRLPKEVKQQKTHTR